MRKMLSATLLLWIVVLLSTLSTPVHATKPETASGDWTYTPTIIDTRLADGNLFKYGEEDGNWEGTFVGTSQDFFTVVAHPSGFVNVQGLINFEGEVNDEEGSLVIRFVGKKTWWDEETFWWSGNWVILSGTDDLENLRGQGTWWGPGFVAGVVEPGYLDYSGKIHFEAD